MKLSDNIKGKISAACQDARGVYMDLDRHRRIINKGKGLTGDSRRAGRDDTHRFSTRPGIFAVNCGLGPFKGSRASRSWGRDAGRNAAESLAIKSQLSQFIEIIPSEELPDASS